MKAPQDKSSLNRFNYMLRKAPAEVKAYWESLKRRRDEQGEGAFVQNVLQVARGNFDGVIALVQTQTSTEKTSFKVMAWDVANSMS